MVGGAPPAAPVAPAALSPAVAATTAATASTPAAPAALSPAVAAATRPRAEANSVKAGRRGRTRRSTPRALADERCRLEGRSSGGRAGYGSSSRSTQPSRLAVRDYLVSLYLVSDLRLFRVFPLMAHRRQIDVGVQTDRPPYWLQLEPGCARVATIATACSVACACASASATASASAALTTANASASALATRQIR
jgi:hypothetical protein